MQKHRIPGDARGLYEVMVMNEKIQELIGGESIDMDRLRNQAMKGGMRNLRLSGATKIASGRNLPLRKSFESPLLWEIESNRS